MPRKSKTGLSRSDSTPRPMRIVAIGGGTGLSTLLRELKNYVTLPRDHAADAPATRAAALPIADLAAIVTVTDDGGSSGRLRREYQMLPPGDIRNCMVALSRDEELLSRLFQYRFATGRDLKGHSFGNLFLTALTHVTGDFTEAVRLSAQVLASRGRIFPATGENVTLEAVLEDGRVVKGETRISASKKRIRRIRLLPPNARPLPQVLRAIARADLITIGPGSLYTSVIPNLLVRGVTAAIRRSRATKVYIANLMTQPGETPGYTVGDHVRAIYEHTSPRLFDWVVVNNAAISPAALRRYRAQGAEPVAYDVRELQQLGLACVLDNLVDEQRVLRHDAARLSRLLMEEFVLRRK